MSTRLVSCADLRGYGEAPVYRDLGVAYVPGGEGMDA